MLHEFSVVLMALAGMAVGLVLALALARVRAVELMALGAAQGRAASSDQLASTAEQARLLEAKLLAQGQERLRLQAQIDPLRQELEAGRIERIKLKERAGRVVSLEAEVARLELQLRMSEEELRRLRASDAKKGRALRAAQEALAHSQQIPG